LLILWKIRYLDREDKQFKDRELLLETTALPPAKRAAVEMLMKSNNRRNERELLKFRRLFTEASEIDVRQRMSAAHELNLFCLIDYLEDERGEEIAANEMARTLTGNPGAVAIPPGAKQHDLDYMFAERKPVPVAEVCLSPDEIRLLGYFVRDFTELKGSELMKDGPGSLSSGGTLPVLPNRDFHHVTAATDDEIRSFVTIFRRLYMEKEPANFIKAADTFKIALGDHPLGRWVKGAADEYEIQLRNTPQTFPVPPPGPGNFTVKRLIDVFLYTQYSHQPDDKRQRQFEECLQQVGARRNVLTWLFLTEIWNCGLKIASAGSAIADWFKHYCEFHRIVPDILGSLRSEHGGLGKAEKEEDRTIRLFREQVEELEVQLWKEAGKPDGGPLQFRLTAQQQLREALGGDKRN
jgi:hypothetical protein